MQKEFLQTLTSGLGASKITMPIRVNQFEQGNTLRSAFPQPSTASTSGSFKSPHELFEQMCGRQHRKGDKNVSNRMPAQADIDPYLKLKVNSKPHVLPAHQPLFQKPSHTKTNANDSFIKLILQIIDPKTELLPDDSVCSVIQKFKADSVANLEGALFKKMGFSRKRGLTCAAMQKTLTALDTDSTLDEHTMTYLAKLSDKHIIVYDGGQVPPLREDFNPDAHECVLMCIKRQATDEDKRYSMILPPSASRSDANVAIYKMLSQTQTDMMFSDATKAKDLRDFAKLFNVAAGLKTEIQEKLKTVRDAII